MGTGQRVQSIRVEEEEEEELYTMSVSINFPFLLDESMNPLVYYFQLVIEMTRYSLPRKLTDAKGYGLIENVDSYSSGQQMMHFYRNSSYHDPD
jgi:hypothetical protein